MVDSVKWFKSRAKALLKSYSNGEPAAHERVDGVLRNADSVTLQRIQHVVAVESGFDHWRALLASSEIERLLVVKMVEEPLLHVRGIGTMDANRGKPREVRAAKMAADRVALRRSVDDVAWTVEWLKANVAPIKTINRRRTSYDLKHIAERRSPKKYLLNGVFIAAAMVAGYPMEIGVDSPNPSFGMSERSIKKLVEDDLIA